MFLHKTMHMLCEDWSVAMIFVFDLGSGCTGGNGDYTMDMHQKEQLHDNAVSMMQSQHFSVSCRQ